ncbi:hypothetical protein GCM10023075_32320 [Streptosporangium album]
MLTGLLTRLSAFGGYTGYDYALYAGDGRLLGKKAMKPRLLVDDGVARWAAGPMKRGLSDRAFSSRRAFHGEECDDGLQLRGGLSRSRLPLPQQGFHGREVGRPAAGDLGGHWFSGKVDHRVITLPVFSARLYGVQPVRRLERSIKVVNDRHGRPSDGHRSSVTLWSCVGGSNAIQRAPGTARDAVVKKSMVPRKPSPVRSEDE